MDAFKEALRRKMMEMKGAQDGKAPMDESGQKDGSDLAPELEGGEGKEGAELEMPVDDPRLMQILEALGDHSPGNGREPGSLQERAAVGARAKLAGMKSKGMKK